MTDDLTATRRTVRRLIVVGAVVEVLAVGALAWKGTPVQAVVPFVTLPGLAYAWHLLRARDRRPAS